MAKVLGVDQSYTSCGLAVADEDKLVAFHRFKTDSTLDVYDRAIQVANFIVEYIQLHKVESVRIEGLAFGMRGDATRDLAGLIFVLITNMRTRCKDVSCSIVAPTSLKKFATGSGKSDKKAMIEALPVDVRDEFVEAGFKKTTGLTDLTDAYWLAMYK